MQLTQLQLHSINPISYCDARWCTSKYLMGMLLQRLLLHCLPPSFLNSLRLALRRTMLIKPIYIFVSTEYDIKTMNMQMLNIWYLSLAGLLVVGVRIDIMLLPKSNIVRTDWEECCIEDDYLCYACSIIDDFIWSSPSKVETQNIGTCTNPHWNVVVMRITFWHGNLRWDNIWAFFLSSKALMITSVSKPLGLLLLSIFCLIGKQKLTKVKWCSNEDWL